MNSREDFADAIAKIADDLKIISIELAVQRNLPPIPAYTGSFLRYYTTQAYRIAAWLREEHAESIDLIAHATRGLFEASCIFAYLMEDRGVHFIKRMTEEALADHFDILKSSFPTSKDLESQSESFIANYHDLKEKRLKKTPPMRELVKIVGAENEYKEYYSHLCKYTHPSLYQLVGDYRQVYSVQAILLFTSRAIQYLKTMEVEAKSLLKLVVDHNENLTNWSEQ
jgi:hypothetical protein